MRRALKDLVRTGHITCLFRRAQFGATYDDRTPSKSEVLLFRIHAGQSIERIRVG